MIEIFVISAVGFQFAAFLLWFVSIRPFLKENGLDSLQGATGLATIINDIEQAIKVSKKKGKCPKSLILLVAMELISAALFFSATMI